MTATFDLYTKRTRLYYTTLAISIVTLVICLVGWLTNPQLPRFLMIFFDVFIFIGGLTIPFFVILTGRGWFITWQKDGEMILADDYLLINNIKIVVGESSKIKLRAGFSPRGRLGYIVSNRIEVTDDNGITHKRRFVIKYDDNGEAFEKITGEWFKKKYADVVYHSV
jgi:hypothetical protein